MSPDIRSAYDESKNAALDIYEMSSLEALYDTLQGENWNWKELDDSYQRVPWNFTRIKDSHDYLYNPCVEPYWQGVDC